MGSMSTDAHKTFIDLLAQLEDWYADSVRAQSYDGSGHGSHELGHVVLRVNRYPGPKWRKAWHDAAGVPEIQEAIIKAVGDELYGLDHGPSQSGPASGLHRGTQEWRLAVATADGSLRSVARRFGISHTEVRRLRVSEAT